MSLFGNIRKRSFIIFLIIGLSFFAFIIDPKILFSFFEKDLNIIGSVNQESIYKDEYIDYVNFQKQFNQNIPENFLLSQVWETIINEKLFIQQAKKLGIQISKKDFWDAIANNSIYTNISYFKKKDGFNMQKFKYYLFNLKKNSKNNGKIFEEYNFWNFQKKIIPKQIIVNQYLDILKNAIMINNKESFFNYWAKNSKANIDYIFFPYSKSEKEYSNISISYKEIINYLNKNKSVYTKEAIRDLVFIVFPSKASFNDLNKIKKEMNILASEFKYIKNNYSFVSKHSEIPYNSGCYTEDSFPLFLRNFIKSAKIGNIYGPIIHSNTFFLVKLTGKKYFSEYTKSSHILISYKGAKNSLVNRNKEEAKKIAYNIYRNVIFNPNKFYRFINKTDDFNSVKNNGSIGWTNNNGHELLPEYQNFLNENPKGRIGIIETSLGYHIIKIDDKSPLKICYQIAAILKYIKPSKETESTIYNNALHFIKNNKKLNKDNFINNARNKNYTVVISNNITSSQSIIKELYSDLDMYIIKWAFSKENKQGATKMFTTSNGSHIIAYISFMKEKGLLPLERVKKEIVFLLKKYKFANILYNKIKKYDNKSLEEIANIFYKKLNKNNYINFANPVLKNIGKESEVIGSAFGIPLGINSMPIVGENGLFLIRTNNRNKIDYNNNINYYNLDYKSNIDFKKEFINFILKYLKNKALINDYRDNLIYK